MAVEAPTYDLVLLLDTSAEAATRKKILADVDKLLSTNKATTVGTHDWGRRKTAYEIDKKTEADYHLIQFQGPSTVPSELDRVLKITDGVLRHRVIKLDPGTPPPPDLKASSPAPPAEAPAEPAPEPEAPAAEAAPEPEAPAVEAEAPAAEAEAPADAAEAPAAE
jgi:small subunit ribosomal protein S6